MKMRGDNLLSSLRGFKRSRLSDCEGMGGGVVERDRRDFVE